MAATPPIIKNVPQEIHDMIAAFADGASLNSLTQTSKAVRQAFLSAFFRGVCFQGRQQSLARKLAAFGFLVSDPSMSDMRREATVVLTCALASWVSVRNSFRGEDVEHPPLVSHTLHVLHSFANLHVLDLEPPPLVSHTIHVLHSFANLRVLDLDIESLSATHSFANLRVLDLDIKSLSATQCDTFIALLEASNKFDTLRTLYLSAPSMPVFKAILNHCSANVLKAIHIDTWVGSERYFLVNDMYRTTPGSAPELLRFHLHVDSDRLTSGEYNAFSCLRHRLDRIKRSFPHLDTLIVSEKPRDILHPLAGRFSHDTIMNQTWNISNLLSNTNIKRLALHFHRNRPLFDANFLRNPNDLRLGVRVTKREINEWDFGVIEALAMDAPKLFQLVIFDEYPGYYVGNRATEGGSVEVQRFVLQKTKHSKAFPCGLS
ncbi:hypothetical protein G7046_g622 [Stylonectria norvegica]|nr:hypothetical protein G7046_g622 [Stylonectria norvegica]